MFDWRGSEKYWTMFYFCFINSFGIVSLFSVIFALFAHFFPLAYLFLYSHLYFILFLAWFDWVLSFSTFIKPINTMVYGDATLVICDYMWRIFDGKFDRVSVCLLCTPMMADGIEHMMKIDGFEQQLTNGISAIVYSSWVIISWNRSAYHFPFSPPPPPDHQYSILKPCVS